MKKGINILLILFAGAVSFMLYTLLHEGGHAIAAMVLGGKVTNFDINFVSGSPHVGYTGITIGYQRAIVRISGVLLPYILWLTSLISFKFNRLVARKTILLYSMVILSSIIPNIILAFLYQTGKKIEGEDIIEFISGVGFNGYAVSIVFVLMLVLGLFLLRWKMDIKQTFLEQVEVELKKKSHKRIVLAVSIVLIFFLTLSCINVLTDSISKQAASIPPKYDKLINIDLSKNISSEETVYEFLAAGDRLYDFILKGKAEGDISIKLIGDVQIQGTRKNELLLVDSPGNINSNYSGWLLNKGRYRIVVSSKTGKGSINLYISTREAAPDILSYSNERIYNADLPKLEKGYELAVKTNLVDCSKENIYSFALDKAEDIEFSIFLTTKTGEAAVDLIGENYKETLVSQYQVYTSERRTTLQKGRYNITLTAKDCNGEVYIYIKK